MYTIGLGPSTLSQITQHVETLILVQSRPCSSRTDLISNGPEGRDPWHWSLKIVLKPSNKQEQATGRELLRAGMVRQGSLGPPGLELDRLDRLDSVVSHAYGSLYEGPADLSRKY